MSEYETEPEKKPSKLKWVISDIRNDFGKISGHIKKAEKTE